jgi:hypothetical protein
MYCRKPIGSAPARFCAMALFSVLTACSDIQSSFYRTETHADLFVQESIDREYDFLWVMDNSDSMKDKRDFVRDNLSAFVRRMNARKQIEYRMAMTTTDFFTGQGDLVRGPNGQAYVSNQSADPNADFAAMIDGIEESSTTFWEQGLESAYQALSLHGSEFLRPDAPLILVFLTDEDDYSCQDHCWGVEPEHNPDWLRFPVQRYVSFFHDLKTASASETLMFPIIGTAGGSCTSITEGKSYLLTQELLGTGKSGSICPADLAKSYQNIAALISDRGYRFNLTQKASASGMRVEVNGVLVPVSSDQGYVYDEETNSILFNGDAVPSTGSQIVVTYAPSQD